MTRPRARFGGGGALNEYDEKVWPAPWASCAVPSSAMRRGGSGAVIAPSPKASFDTKARAAFRMYDFDGDGFLSEDDLTTLLATLTAPPGAEEPMLKEGEVRRLVSHVMAEGDVDGNKRLNFTEFERLARRLPDFSTRFRVFIS